LEYKVALIPTNEDNRLRAIENITLLDVVDEDCNDLISKE
jgi:hypothetical protein